MPTTQNIAITLPPSHDTILYASKSTPFESMVFLLAIYKRLLNQDLDEQMYELVRAERHIDTAPTTYLVKSGFPWRTWV